MLPCPRSRLCPVLVIAAIALSLTYPAVGDSDTSAPDQARWKDGELLAPLPSDPVKRAAALEQARAFGASRAGDIPGAKSVTYRTAATPPPVVYPARATTPAPKLNLPAADPAQVIWLEALEKRLRRSEERLAAPGAQPTTTVSEPASVALELSPDPLAMPFTNSFDGIDDTGWDPGAPDIAVGPEHILLATTDRFAIMDKCGNTLFTDLFRDFFNQPMTRSYYTPKVVYDSWTPRWIMVYIGTETNFSNSVLYVAVSETADPLGAWYHYPIQTTGFLPGLRDGPAIAVTPNEIYITYNQFNLGTFAFEQSVILELVKDDVYSQVAVNLFNHQGMLNPNDASVAFSVHPAQMRTYSGTMYFVNNKQGGGNFFTLWKLIDLPGSSTLTGYDVPTLAYAAPPDMVQPNATLVDAGDCRVRDAVYSSGNLYAAFTRDTFGSPTVQTEQITVTTLAHTGVFIGGGDDFGYPAIDIDENDQFTFAYAVSGPAKFLGIQYYILTLPLVAIETGQIMSGLADFSSGPAPYRWGPYFGAALDPADGRTVWIHGSYASNAPLNSWTTRVGAVTGFTASDLTVAAVGPTYVAGFEGGPFSPEHIDVQISNAGSAEANWNLAGVPTWLTVAEQSGSLDPGDSELLSFFVNEQANFFSQGTHGANLLFTNCTGNGAASVPVTLAVGLDASCPGTQLTLGPQVLPTGGSVDPASTDLGVFVTAMRDVHICAIGIEAGLSVPQSVTANVYAAAGTTRGALAYSSLAFLVANGNYGMHVIPIDATLSECAEYDIAVEFGASVSWSYWDDPAGGVAPLDVGGLVRVRDAEVNGSAADTRLPRIVLYTDTGTCANSTDLDAGAGEAVQFTANDSRGLFVNPERTVRLCSVGIEGDFVVGAHLTARVYKVAGAVRTALLATGTTIVSAPLFQFHDVPISQVLLSGSQYDIEVEFEDTGAWTRFATPPAVIPYTVGNEMTVYGAETGGIITGVLPHLRLAWSDEPAGIPFDLAKQGDVYPPPFTSNSSLAHGAYITSLIDQEVYGVGVMADVPDGGFVTAFVYEASGTTRGALVSTASVVSNGGGLRWHDIPVAASFVASGEYDIALSAPAPVSWPRWNDSPGLPYDAYGTIRVRDAEAGGLVGTSFLSHMRVHACNAILTDVGGGPERVPMMLDPPAPNPSTGMVHFGYALDEAGDVEIAVYDVRGRRVAEVARKRSLQAGRSSVDYDTSKLPSGVYFVRLTTPTRSTSRKFVVTH